MNDSNKRPLKVDDYVRILRCSHRTDVEGLTGVLVQTDREYDRGLHYRVSVDGMPRETSFWVEAIEHVEATAMLPSATLPEVWRRGVQASLEAVETMLRGLGHHTLEGAVSLARQVLSGPWQGWEVFETSRLRLSRRYGLATESSAE